MSLETGTYISDLNPANPPGGDAILQGDDHIRLVKDVAQNTFPNADRPFMFPNALAKTGAYTVLFEDEHFFITGDATGGAFSLTLPTLTSDNDGWYAIFQKIDSSVNAVTVAGTVNGSASGVVLAAQYQSAIVWWDGAAFYALALSSGGSIRTVTTTGNITLADIGGTVISNPGANITLTLPAAAGWAGRSVKIKHIATGFNTTIDGNGAETVEGTSTIVVKRPQEVVELTSDGTNVRLTSPTCPVESFTVAMSDEDTALSTGTAKITWRAPYPLTVLEVRASLSTAQSSGSALTVDVNEGGSTILSTKLTFDNGEKTTFTASTPAVVSDNSIAEDAELTGDIDTIGDGTAKGLKLTFIVRRVLS